MNTKLILKATILFSISVDGKVIRKCVLKIQKYSVSAQGYEYTFAVKTDNIGHKIIDVYNIGANGNKQKGASKYVGIELAVKAGVIPSFGVASNDEANPFT
ncbi:hypothetical protein H8356DRAFT_1271827 [Neocallimastix lanati (nom. inval.)]|uniref:Uncharacterized protein n=1 Tax=Neocallimastix californiae TaxID=1754190 RepID=A0A1Y2D6U5_9FUNG|nr:hypothetical protein H8356DRAFT_1271827 [Neocallimastix sp. JGI-2020a]ORY54305.1 hypothetical protein LY90DRAFT_507674 [Neocallimastix californiae]|eukprot:ORY54305.1 hypothetical protein LY90DRAFT_507674 [Neocallimastix californiae]